MPFLTLLIHLCNKISLDTDRTVHTAPAQGIIAQLRILGGSIGIATSSAILGVHTRDQLTGILTPEQMRSLAAHESTLTPEQYTAVRVAYTDALREGMIICCVILGVCLFITVFVYKKDRVSLDEMQRRRVIEEQERRLAAQAPSTATGGAIATGGTTDSV
jgi:hypothetical protein